MGGKYGTALAAAALNGDEQMVSLLLKCGPCAMRVGGSYSTASVVYPSALDIIHLRDSRPNPALLALLTTAIIKQNPNVDPVGNVVVISASISYAMDWAVFCVMRCSPRGYMAIEFKWMKYDQR